MKLTPKHKRPLKFKITLFVIIFVLVIGAVGVAYILFMKKGSTTTHSANNSTFTFDANALPAWTSGGTNHATTNTTLSDPHATTLPTADIIIHLKDTSDPSNCFVIYSYIESTKNAETALKEQLDLASATNSDLTYRQTDVKKLSMKTSEGMKDFELHQFSIEGDPNANMLRATEFGFFNVGKGYMDIRGNCTSPDQLEKTLSVLDAVSFQI